MNAALGVKLLTIIGAIVLVYVAFVAVVEVLIWRLQPDMEGAVVITTTAADGRTYDSTLASLYLEDQLYVASNHWVRGWYDRAPERPRVRVSVDNEPRPYTAIEVRGAEHERLWSEYSMGFLLHLVCGFAPSRFLRLEGPHPS